MAEDLYGKLVERGALLCGHCCKTAPTTHGGQCASVVLYLELCLAVLAHHLMILSLLALDDNMISLWSLGRGHSNEYGACGAVGGYLGGG